MLWCKTRIFRKIDSFCKVSETFYASSITLSGVRSQSQIGKAILFSGNVQQAIGNVNSVKPIHRCLDLHAPYGESNCGPGPHQGYSPAALVRRAPKFGRQAHSAAPLFVSI